MLAEIGIDSIEQLFSGIPERSRLRRLLNIPKALTEPELIDYFRERAARNAVDYTSFVGAGVYPGLREAQAAFAVGVRVFEPTPDQEAYTALYRRYRTLPPALQPYYAAK